MGKWVVRTVFLLILAGLIGFGWRSLRRKPEVTIRTTPVTRGPLALAVTATGRLAPTTEVLVGCEVSGTVQEVLVSHNDRIRRGQVLARLKPELYRAEHEQAKADLARANAVLHEQEVERDEAKRQFERIDGLRRKGAASEEEHKALKAKHDAMLANVEAARAAIEGAKSRVDLTKYSLDCTEIVSPIDGIVLDRQVDAGQTVTSRLKSPDLFILAEDLARMELLTDVSEADIGHICPGQHASFAVNAYRDRTFTGQVRQVRNQPRALSNVVTYTVVIDVENRDRLLRPGMPADVGIEIVRQDGIMKVANAALRFRPPLGPERIRAMLDSMTWPPAPEPIRITPASGPDSRGADAEIAPPPIRPEKATLWRHSDGAWVSMPVWTRFTDNRDTAVVGGADLVEGTAYVTEMDRPEESGSFLQRIIMLSRPENRRF
ncbi:MAG: efflux RND transporter periplasmic adaptor subunit [Phycisphaerae bacterium]|nr:efflux RND transporter periplasmic adaptor subunit [Phycisphaerae bacterium]